ncbi:MAG: hypothetical protein HC892_01500 [Saprospiraceae bacterium]|nr:hypothetical protein [Saprospiraceae bacterium]
MKNKIEKIDKGTEVAQIMQKYPKVIYWLFWGAFILSSGSNVYGLLKLIFTP